MEELAVKDPAGVAVDLVAKDWETDVGQVNANLVSAAGFQRYGQQGVPVEVFGGAVVGTSGASVCDNGHVLAMVRMSGDGGVNGPGVRSDYAHGDGLVLLDDGALFHLLGEPLVGQLTLGDDQQAGGVTVQAVDDARTQFASHAADVGAAGQQGIDQGAVGMAGAGMHRQASRLDDDDDVIVLVNDADRDVLGKEVGGQSGGRHGYDDDIAVVEALGRSGRLSV